MNSSRSPRHGNQTGAGTSEDAERSLADRSIIERRLRLIPDAILPEQFFSRPVECEEMTGARGLMLAMLEDAIRCYLELQHHSRLDLQRTSRQAEAWIRSSGGSWPFSFDNVCHSLSIDPGHLRSRLLARGAKTAPKSPPRRPAHRVQRAPMHRVQKPRAR